RAGVRVFFFQAEAGIRSRTVTGVQTCALPISPLAPVVEIRRRGFMIGVELGPYAYEQTMGARVCFDLRKRGVLLRPLGNVLVMMPPLSITDDEINRLVDATRASILEVCGAPR